MTQSQLMKINLENSVILKLIISEIEKNFYDTTKFLLM